MSNLLFITVFSLFAMNIVLFVFFTEKLKKLFPEKYEDLGSPTIFSVKGGTSDFKKFLIKREYIALENDSLKQMGNFYLITRILCYIGLASLFITFFVP